MTARCRCVNRRFQATFAHVDPVDLEPFFRTQCGSTHRFELVSTGFDPRTSFVGRCTRIVLALIRCHDLQKLRSFAERGNQ